MLILQVNLKVQYRDERVLQQYTVIFLIYLWHLWMLYIKMALKGCYFSLCYLLESLGNIKRLICAVMLRERLGQYIVYTYIAECMKNNLQKTLACPKLVYLCFIVA